MKDGIRKEMIAKREAHHNGGGHMLCLSIMDSVMHLPEFKSAKCILLYSAIRGEVHTDGIMQSALSLGKRVALPVTKKEGKTLELYSFSSMEELKKGAFGIPEPPAEAKMRVQPEEVELAIVPGVCFDRRGHRIGYGMGYYDALLKKIGGRKIGLAYGFQIVDKVPDEVHDVAMDAIISEGEKIECKKG